MFRMQFSSEFFIQRSGAGSVTYSSRIDHRCGHRLLRAALASAIFLSIGINAEGQPVTGSFTHEGRTLKYKYTLENLPTSGQPPGLLLYFHGHNSGSQEDLLRLSPYTQEIADSNGLIYVKLASPALRDGTLGGVGTRHWHDEDIAVVQDFLQTGLPSNLAFDSNRIVFWGGSQGTCFLNTFVVLHGMSYGGGLYAQCGCFNLSPRTQWDVPPVFKNRFKVLVQATTGDYLYGESIQAYWFYKYWIGLDTFGDLSEDGGHCSGNWTVTDEDAIGWLLGARSLLTESAADQSESELPLRLADKRETVEGSCSLGRFISERRGDGPALWFPVNEDGDAEIPPGNAVAYFRVETIAGTGEFGYSGDGGPATQAQLSRPSGLAVDGSGNVYVADYWDHRVRRINASGRIQTIAGTGHEGFSGDGGLATQARLSGPSGLAVDSAGNVYVADRGNHRVRRIDPSGQIETIAGTGHGGYSGDGGPATQARLSEPFGLAVDGLGNVYVADKADHRVRRIDPSGQIETIAGTGHRGYSGDGGPAAEAQLHDPVALAVDGSGNVYVADYWNHRVRRIDPSGQIETIAGTGEYGYSGDGGPATQAQLSVPHGLAVDGSGNVYVADSENHRVRRIDASGRIETIAGTGEYGYSGDGGPATQAQLSQPTTLTMGGSSRILVAGHHRIRGVSRTQRPKVSLGRSGESLELDVSETGLLTMQGEPTFVGAQVIASNGDRYALTQFADRRIVAIPVTHAPLRVGTTTAQPGISRLRTIGGTGEAGHSGDGGPATDALLTAYSVAVDASGNVYVADPWNHRVRRINPWGRIETIAGIGHQGYSGDGGPATDAQLQGPAGVAVDASGNVYVADAWDHRVRRIDPSGMIVTVAGTGVEGYSGDGGPATDAQLAQPASVAVDASGNVYVADVWNNRVRRIDPSGMIVTVAGTGEAGHSGDGGPATDAQLEPRSLAVDVLGNVYVADPWNRRVRRIAPSGVIVTVAGTGEAGHSGDGGPATDAQLTPSSVAADASGNVYVADPISHRVRRIDPSGVIVTVAGTGEAGYSGDGGPATDAQLNEPVDVALDASGNVYVVDLLNYRVRLVTKSPYWISVQLGSSSDTLTLDVSRQGAVTHFGQPAVIGSRLAACNGNIYALRRSPNGGIQAAYVSERQAVGLGDRRPITFERDEAGAWRVGRDVVRSGYRHIQSDREYVLDVAEGRWRLASHVLRTVAGNSGVDDGVRASASALYAPSSVDSDSAGNLYVADRENNRIRRIHTSGEITTLAGTGERGYSGDGGPAAEARLDRPAAVAVDRAGNVYVADTGNQRVRRIDLSGTIETYAGTGEQGYSGDGGPAEGASLSNPLGLATDAVGNVYVADAGNQRVRRISLSGTIETYAGTGERGYSDDGLLASEIQMNGPTGVAADAAGNVYVADFFNQRVYRIEPTGIITAIAGNGESGHTGDGGAGTEASLDGPTDVAVDEAGNIYIADYLDRRVRRVDPTGTITTVAGTGNSGYAGDGGPAAEAQLAGPFGLAADTAGNIFVADLTGHRVRRIDVSGNISTVAGTGRPFERSDGGLASRARLSHAIEGVAVDPTGNVYVADPYDHLVRQIDASETISTFVGTGTAGFGGDGGLATDALLDGPTSVAVDAVGNVFVADTGNHRVRRIDAAGTVITLAGTGTPGYSGEYLRATSSKLNRPTRVATNAEGRVYVLDAGNHRVRAISSAGRIRTVAGNGVEESAALMYRLARLFLEYDAIKAPLFGASGLALDSADSGAGDTLYLAGGSLGFNLLWSVPLDTGLIGKFFIVATGGEVTAVATGGDGRVYFADDRGIFVIGRDGSASIIAESGEYDISVGGMAVDEFGRIWFSDPEHRRVRVLEPLKQ